MPENPNKHSKFWQELKTRKAFRRIVLNILVLLIFLQFTTNIGLNVEPPLWLLTVLIIVILIFLGFYMWRTFDLKQQRSVMQKEITKATFEIKAQKDEITAQRDQLKIQHDTVVEQKNMIVESINYAQRIQAALLPPVTLFIEHLNEVFILFKPRDIVSGDFYWIKQVNQYTVLVAADCTGHGVPGAFMSILGISILNEIVQRDEIIRANQILNELRYQIKHSLRQQGHPDESKDGIDMAICVIDRKSRQMQYSGANNPLYLIKEVDGSPKLHEIKADKMPVGYYLEKDESFTNHDISLELGDTFYLFSDGFIDQKGGGDNKKFMRRNFKELLLEIQEESMYEQKRILDIRLSEWMDGREQMDDILVVGVRI